MTKPKNGRIIGSATRYLGHETCHGGHGAKVLVAAVLRRTADPDDPDSYVTSNSRLDALGGVRRGDGAEVHVWLPKDKRFSWVANEIEDITQLARCRHLANEQAAP